MNETIGICKKCGVGICEKNWRMKKTTGKPLFTSCRHCTSKSQVCLLDERYYGVEVYAIARKNRSRIKNVIFVYKNQASIKIRRNSYKKQGYQFHRKWISDNPEKTKEYAAKYVKGGVISLSHNYIKRTIKRGIAPGLSIPQEFIDVKRLIIQVKRKIITLMGNNEPGTSMTVSPQSELTILIPASNLKTLRKSMYDVFNGLDTGECTIALANEKTKAANTILKSMVVEMMKNTHNRQIAFIED